MNKRMVELVWENGIGEMNQNWQKDMGGFIETSPAGLA